MLRKHWEKQSTRIDVTLEKITDECAPSNYFIIEQAGSDLIQTLFFHAKVYFLGVSSPNHCYARFCNIHLLKPPNLGGLGDRVLSGMGHCFDILEKRSTCNISRTNNVQCFQFKEMLALTM